jgi:hypothetical protein
MRKREAVVGRSRSASASRPAWAGGDVAADDDRVLAADWRSLSRDVRAGSRHETVVDDWLGAPMF